MTSRGSRKTHCTRPMPSSGTTRRPTDHLLRRREDAPDVLDAYLESVGGREAVLEQSTKATKGKKRGRQPGSGAGTAAKRARNGAHPADSPAPATAKKFTPPPGPWEDLVESVEASQDERTGKLMVYLTWKNGYKTRHETSVVHKKLPQKVDCSMPHNVKIALSSVLTRPRCANSTKATFALSLATRVSTRSKGERYGQSRRVRRKPHYKICFQAEEGAVAARLGVQESTRPFAFSGFQYLDGFAVFRVGFYFAFLYHQIGCRRH